MVKAVINQKTYVDDAEKVIKNLYAVNEDTNKGTNRSNMITTSKIRRILAMSADIYNYVMSQETGNPDELMAKIDYLRMRCVYECGREAVVKRFVDGSKLLDALVYIKSLTASDDVDNEKLYVDIKREYILFNRYLEALVAYHRFYGNE
ncbi:MAG: type III-A CRISPR-associated protein Csm2 [Lachnospiraceae bacterium]|nr:type III-A CRISPR-associated protein Csm2 [Lachnospiraceae bacterium]